LSREPIRVLVAVDQPMVRIGVATLLLGFSDMVLAGEALTGREAIDQCAVLKPDVILLDMLISDMGCVETTLAIHQRYPNIQVILLTNWNEHDLVMQALSKGAKGYLLKNVTAEELAEAIRLAIPPKETPGVPLDLGSDITDREMEILKSMSNGLTNGQIANDLQMSRSTVKYHVSIILSKLGVASRTEAVALAVKIHLVPGPGEGGTLPIGH